MDVPNTQGNDLNLVFFPAPTFGSLVGFTGGSIVPGCDCPFPHSVVSTDISELTALYEISSGSITPAPEPSSLILFSSGLLVLGLTRRFAKKAGHPLSA